MKRNRYSGTSVCFPMWIVDIVEEARNDLVLTSHAGFIKFAVISTLLNLDYGTDEQKASLRAARDTIVSNAQLTKQAMQNAE